MLDLNGLRMHVSATGAAGVVNSDTRLQIVQKGSRVVARYAGGQVTRGCLSGRLTDSELTFRYLQAEAAGQLHSGYSTCTVERLGTGRIRIVERFTWTSRPGTGTNVFDELVE